MRLLVQPRSGECRGESSGALEKGRSSEFPLPPPAPGESSRARERAREANEGERASDCMCACASRHARNPAPWRCAGWAPGCLCTQHKAPFSTGKWRVLQMPQAARTRRTRSC